MSLLIESIKIFNGRIYNLQRHEDRMRQSREALLSHDVAAISLRKHIVIPDYLQSGLVKCRVVYGQDIEEILYSAYTPKIIHSLKLVEDDFIDYSSKYLDRKRINRLFAQRGDCSDIIVVKNGMLTDSSYSNIALLKNDVWYTPTTYLLQGTRRQQLIDQGRLIEADIPADSIHDFQKISLINAMMALGQITIPIRIGQTVVK